MISPRELRVGNLVRCLVHLPIGFNRPALSFSKIKEIREDQLETTGGFNRFRDVSPITLTEDVLVKNGGEKVGEQLIKFVEPNFPDLFILNENDRFYLSNPESEKLSIQIDSIHRFQNLYYALRGKDIRICI